jgi:hypothetical protein
MIGHIRFVSILALINIEVGGFGLVEEGSGGL